MNLELLRKPFPKEIIKQRRGNFGKLIDYVECHHYIIRLNQAFEGRLSFDIIWPHDLTVYLNPELLDKLDEVIVLGQLEAEGERKTQFGCSKVTRDKETGEPVSLGDDLKAAGSDSLKKCATLFELGIQFYGNDGQGLAANPELDGSDDQLGDDGRISNSQIREIFSLAKDLSVSQKRVRARVRQIFGKDLSDFSSEEAEELIAKMNASA